MGAESTEAAELVLDAVGIRRLLPHRYPFLYVDRAFVVERGVYGYGIKNVTCNEPYFVGHFPSNPIMPGVVIVEALAQLIALVYGSKFVGSPSEIPDVSANVGLLAAVNVKFLRLVTPGDQLRLEARLQQRLGAMSSFGVEASVESQCAAKGTISVTERRDD
jgi:3-hydroxyacyl-[acyl-carrier-protein] dehydratase